MINQQLTIKFITIFRYNTGVKVGELMAINNLLMMEVGKRIADRRRQLGLTQEELAEKGDLTPQFVSYAELGKRAMRPENLLKLSEALGVSTDYLLTGYRNDRDDNSIKTKFNALSPNQQNAVEIIIDDLLNIKKE